MTRKQSENGHPILSLADFLPYRLSVLSNRISSAIAQRYGQRFNLSMPEWRVMAILGETPGVSAGEVATRTAMDKVAVSRAVGRLIEAGRLIRQVSSDDRRRSVLKLSARGLAVYEQVAPEARAYEASILEKLAPDERTQLNALLSKLTDIQVDIGDISPGN